MTLTTPLGETRPTQTASPAPDQRIVMAEPPTTARATDVPPANALGQHHPAAEATPAAPVPCRLTGSAPARTAHELAALMRSAGLDQTALETTAAWLSGERRQSARTQAGYVRDLAWWLTYAAARGLDVVDAPPAEADLYAAALRAAGLADATRARRLSAASSWYAYLVRSGAAVRNPFGEGMERPSVPQSSTTRGLSEDELERLLAYALTHETARTYALLALMVATGCRVSSVTGTTLGSLGRDRGHATIDLPTKGGKTKRLVLPPFAAEAVERYLTERGDDPGPLFATRTGKAMDQPAVFRLIRRIAAAAGIPGADQLSPHGLRHSVATLLLDRGHPLHVVQDLLGHADPRTTRRYDRARESLDRSPAYDLGQVLAAGIARHAAEAGANTSTLLAYSGHTSVASLARYARVSPEALQAWQQDRDPARRR